jgi:hypothetical protein
MCSGGLIHIYPHPLAGARFISTGRENFKKCTHTSVFYRDNGGAPAFLTSNLLPINHLLIINKLAPRLLLYGDIVLLTDCTPMIDWREKSLGDNLALAIFVMTLASIKNESTRLGV